ncbi:hypothetical protein [Kamptonema formosum]|nr:hypothetical protein [Kamptonema formosum]
MRVKLMGAWRYLLRGIICGILSLAAIASTALGEIKELDFTINSNGSESFGSLIQQAEEYAKTSIDREFKADPNLTEISIVILIDRQKQVVPILRSRVSRSQWQRDTRIDQWTRYFGDAKILLGLRNTNLPQASFPASQTSLPFSERRRLIENDPGFRDD